MKICIIHGSPRKGNTFKAAEIFKNRLLEKEELEVSEFFLPRDMPGFCCGCFTCFEKGEDNCPHSQYTQPIAQKIRGADGLIMTSPVYVLDASGPMKAFLDHYGYMFIPHRPYPEMFSKIAMVISTTAGAGTRNAMKTVSRSLRYWGVKRLKKCGLTLYKKEWDNMPEKKQQRFEKKLCKKADSFYILLKKRHRLPTVLFTRIVFWMIKKLIRSYPADNPDRKYWEKKGWLKRGSSPF